MPITLFMQRREDERERAFNVAYMDAAKCTFGPESLGRPDPALPLKVRRRSTPRPIKVPQLKVPQIKVRSRTGGRQSIAVAALSTRMLAPPRPARVRAEPPASGQLCRYHTRTRTHTHTPHTQSNGSRSHRRRSRTPPRLSKSIAVAAVSPRILAPRPASRTSSSSSKDCV